MEVMTKLKPVKAGMNKYCGPAVLSILTGRDTDECAKVISSINGAYNVAGVLISDLMYAAEKLGFNYEKTSTGGSLYRTLVTLSDRDGMYVVMVSNHFVCVEVKEKQIYFCDNHTKEPIPAASSARLMQPVLAAYRLEKNPSYVEPVKRKPRPEYNLLYRYQCKSCKAEASYRDEVIHTNECEYENAK